MAIKTQNKMTVAQIIRDQIWERDRMALWAWGATKHGDLIGKENGLAIRVRNCPNLKKGYKYYVNVIYDEGRDLYNVDLTRIRGTKVAVVERIEGVYVDQLIQVIDALVG